jgi:hypothetical protein
MGQHPVLHLPLVARTPAHLLIGELRWRFFRLGEDL